MAHYQEIGDLFKAARREMHISIPDAAARLHIRPRYLEALEAGSLRELPGISYTKGYIARYATFLRLDKDEVLRRFDRVEAAVGRRGFYLPLTFSNEKRPSRIMAWGMLVLALLLYLGWSQFMLPQHTQAPVVESIEKAQARKIVLSATTVERNPCLTPPEKLFPFCFWQAIGSDPAVLLIEAQYTAAIRMHAEQSSLRLVESELEKSLKTQPEKAEKKAPARQRPVSKEPQEEALPEEATQLEEEEVKHVYPSDDRR